MRSAVPFSVVGRVLCAGALSGALIAACSASAGSGGAESGSGDPSGTGAGNPGGTGAGNPGGTGGEGGGFIPAGAGGSSGTAGGNDNCAATVNKGQAVPLDMYIMMDQSGSMGDAAGSSTKWETVKGALTNFLQQPTATGIGVGIQYFPISTGLMCPLVPFCTTNANCGPAACGPCVPPLPGLPGVCQGSTAGDSCVAADYATPDVPIAPLPAVATALINSMGAHGPTGGTPTSAALQGAIDYAKKWATQNPSHTVITVFATDGQPSGCDEDLSHINAIAAAGVNGSPSIKTFVIGVGSSLTSMNGIAAAGGTNAAYLIDANAGAGDEFLQAMNDIRGSALSCGYLIPQPPPGEMIDYNAINVQYTPTGGMPTLMPRVDGPVACPTDGFAWYYDNASPPTQILLCDSTCSQISKDSTGQVDVLVGCATIVK